MKNNDNYNYKDKRCTIKNYEFKGQSGIVEFGNEGCVAVRLDNGQLIGTMIYNTDLQEK